MTRRSAKQKKVLNATGLHREPLSRFVLEGEFDHDLVARLLVAMQEHSKIVKPPTLGIIGKEHLQKRLVASGAQMESFVYQRVAKIEDGLPKLAEFAFGFCGEGSRRLVTGLNWSPGIVNPFRKLGPFGQSLDTILSQQWTDQRDPVIYLLHVACPHLQRTDRGKTSVVIE